MSGGMFFVVRLSEIYINMFSFFELPCVCEQGQGCSACFRHLSEAPPSTFIFLKCSHQSADRRRGKNDDQKGVLPPGISFSSSYQIVLRIIIFQFQSKTPFGRDATHAIKIKEEQKNWAQNRFTEDENGWTVVQEGRAQVLFPSQKDVFYNPVQARLISQQSLHNLKYHV